MALWECAECTAKYSVGAPGCPECGSVVRVDERTQPEEEQDMAKITVHGGPSNEADEQAGGEDVPAGGSAETSSEPESSPPEPSEKPTRTPARKTASRAKKDTE
jgi:hypothetical protein